MSRLEPTVPIRLRIEGMVFGNCATRVEHALRSLPGVTRAVVSLSTQTATIDSSEAAPSRAQFAEVVRRAGYDIDTFRQSDSACPGLEPTYAARTREQRQALAQAIGMGLPIMVLHWLAPTLRSNETGGQVWPTAIQALLCFVLLSSPAGAPILVGGLRALIHRAPNTDLLLALGVVASLAAGIASLVAGQGNTLPFHTVATILTVAAAGRLFLLQAQRKAASALSLLYQRNASADPPGPDLTIANMIRDVEQAQTGQIVRHTLVDRVSGMFMPFVLLCAVATVFGSHFAQSVDWSDALLRAVPVLVAASPGALGLAVPTVVLVATASAALDGILIRDAAALGKKSARITQQNMTWAFAYNLIALPLAAMGKIPPGVAAAGAAAATIGVVLNSLRLRSDGSPGGCQSADGSPHGLTGAANG